MWEIEIKHEGLHAYRKVRGATKDEAETKARLQIDAWNARWKRLVHTAVEREQRLRKRNWAEAQSETDKRAREHALALTKDAEATLAALKDLLGRALTQVHPFDWEGLKDKSRFEKPEPSPPTLETHPTEPI